MSGLTKDLFDTTAGWWFFSILFPAFLISCGAIPVYNQRCLVPWVELGRPAAIIDGVGFIALGMACLGLPRISIARREGMARWNRGRIYLGLGIGVACLGIAEFMGT